MEYKCITKQTVFQALLQIKNQNTHHAPKHPYFPLPKQSSLTPLEVTPPSGLLHDPFCRHSPPLKKKKVLLSRQASLHTIVQFRLFWNVIKWNHIGCLYLLSLIICSGDSLPHCVQLWFIFMTVQYSSVRIYNLLVHFTADKHLSCFHWQMISLILVRIFWQTCVLTVQ